MASGPEAMYADFFGLRERPFTLLPDPSFLFWSERHKSAFTILEFGLLSRAPVTLITGEIGTGKTTLVQELLTRMEAHITVGLVSNAQGGRGELLQWIMNALALEIDSSTSYVQRFQQLQDFLINEFARNRRVILIVDEAQNLAFEDLEELRMLTNINSNKDELIQLILVGQPELRDMIRSPRMKQLSQRVTASFHLSEMDAESVHDYIAHRLRRAGGSGTEFTPRAGELIYYETQGIPRLVNQLCDVAMLFAFSADKKVVTEDIIHNVIADGVFLPARNRSTADEEFLSAHDRAKTTAE